MSDETPTGRQCDDQLLKAIDKNDIAEVRRLLESGVCPNGRRNSDPDLSPLTKAVRLGRLEIMSILFQHKVKPGVDELGHTDIHLAVSNGDAVVLQTLLYYWKDEGYQLFNPTFSENPVHTTAEAGNLECLKLFQAAGLDISYTDRFLGMATLHYACQCKHARGADVVRYLLESGAADVNVITKLEQESLLWYAASTGNGDTISALLQASPPPDLGLRNRLGQTVLHAAASYCPLPVLQWVVLASVDIHARSKSNASILHYAAEAGRLDSLVWILENSSLGIDKRESHGWTPLHYAAAANQVQVARFLLNRGANANARSAPGNHTPLHLAAAYIDGEVNAVFDDGNDDASLVECLLLHGADVAALGDRRALVSDSARGEEFHDWKYTDTEEEEEAGPPIEDVHPLHCAAFAGNINIAEKLLAAGADIHCRTSIKGSTPLHIAAAQFLLAMLRFLLRNGAEYTLEDYGGRKMVHRHAFMARRKPERAKMFLVDEGIYHPEMDGDLDWRRGIEMMQEYYEIKNLGQIMLL